MQEMDEKRLGVLSSTSKKAKELKNKETEEEDKNIARYNYSYKIHV